MTCDIGSSIDSLIATSKEEGRVEGLAEGEAKGRAEGEAKGRAEGLGILFTLVENGKLALTDAANTLKTTVDNFLNMMTDAGYQAPLGA